MEQERAQISTAPILAQETEEIPATGRAAADDAGPRRSREKQHYSAAQDRFSRNRWEALIASTSDAMIILDEQFTIRTLNPAASGTLGLTQKDAIGCLCSETLHCRNLNKTLLCGTSGCPLKRALAGEQPLTNEELILAGDLEVSLSVVPIASADGQREAAFIARDMSALHLANQVRSNFVSMVSHELRTPLNSVHGFIDLLMLGHMGKLTGEQRKYLGYAQEGVEQLILIVEDILLLTRSDVGQFEMKPTQFNFRVLARQVISSLEPQARKASVILTKDMSSPAPILYGDPQRMQQVLNNLIVNAIKFTPPGGIVTLRARPYDDQFVLISVVDTGYGISEEDRPHIFERFYQSNHHQQSKVGGYGLGLAIARLIVEQHGGTINFETETGKGSTFYFTAPLYSGQSTESR